nr:DUF2238 domain-containing protein [uncultured Holophaga sp.]
MPRACGLTGNRFLQVLLGCYAVVWLWGAWRPLYPANWLLENWLVFAFLAALLVTARRFRFSDRSYALFVVFLVLHVLGAHYAYANVPLGDWIKVLFHLERNPFDRMVAFSFGLLLAYPVQEVFVRQVGVRGGWSYYLPVEMVLACAAVYEIIEAVTAQLSGPDLGSVYLGAQGDVWDAQMDMAMATLGAILAMLVVWGVRRWQRLR